MRLTTRELLERDSAELKSLAHDIEAKGDKATPDDYAQLNQLSAKVEASLAQLKVNSLSDTSGGTIAGHPIDSPAGQALLNGSAAAPARSNQGNWSATEPHRAEKTGWSDEILKAATDSFGYFKSLVPSGSVVVPRLADTIVRTADRPRSILELVPTTPLTGTDQYSYLKETVRTHNAAPVAVGALKPTSVYSVARVDSTVKTIAHLSEAIPRQWLADQRLLQDYVEGSLREGVMLAVENEIVNGDGTGQHFLGIDDESNHQQQAWSSDLLRTTRKAVTKLETVQIPSGTFVFNPADWESIELFADSSGNFILGDHLPVDRANRRLWGMQVVTSTVVTAGIGFLVDFKGSTQLWEREAVRLDWSENTYDPDAISEGVGATDFARNMIRFRAEGRWGFAVTRPAGVVEIDLTA